MHEPHVVICILNFEPFLVSLALISSLNKLLDKYFECFCVHFFAGIDEFFWRVPRRVCHCIQVLECRPIRKHQGTHCRHGGELGELQYFSHQFTTMCHTEIISTHMYAIGKGFTHNT